jgi:hypothetical protein
VIHILAARLILRRRKNGEREKRDEAHRRHGESSSYFHKTARGAFEEGL